MRTATTLIIAISFFFTLQAAEPSELEKTVTHLLTLVEKSDAIFIRNGDEHKGKDAAAHMRKKFSHYKKKIKSPEDFIELCATKSELSGKPYKIKSADGKILDSKEWFLARLSEYQKKP